MKRVWLLLGVGLVAAVLVVRWQQVGHVAPSKAGSSPAPMKTAQASGSFAQATAGSDTKVESVAKQDHDGAAATNQHLAAFRDQLSPPMTVVLDDTQQARIKELEVQLTALTGKARLARQKIAAAQYAALKGNPELRALAERVGVLDQEVRQSIQSQPKMVAAVEEKARRQNDLNALEAHAEELNQAVDADKDERNGVDCPRCRAIAVTLPAHGPASHKELASYAAELARKEYVAASRNVVAIERDLKTNNVQVSAKLQASRSARTELDAQLQRLPEVVGLLAEEQRLLAEHKEVQAQCRSIRQSARREPIRLANPSEPAAAGTGT